jgi:hypothetical protein
MQRLPSHNAQARAHGGPGAPAVHWQPTLARGRCHPGARPRSRMHYGTGPHTVLRQVWGLFGAPRPRTPCPLPRPPNGARRPGAAPHTRGLSAVARHPQRRRNALPPQTRWTLPRLGRECRQVRRYWARHQQRKKTQAPCCQRRRFRCITRPAEETHLACRRSSACRRRARGHH